MAQSYGTKGQDEPDLARDMARLGRPETAARGNLQQENCPQSEICLSVAMNRMASFARLDQLLMSINVRKLANAGLYYPGTGNKLVCFHCNGTIDIENWTDHEEPIGKHNRLYPQCTYSNALDVADGGISHRVNGECKLTKIPQPSSNCERTVDLTDAGASNLKKTEVNDVRSCNRSCPKDLNTELHRLHTYYGYGWPMNTPVSPEQLAKLGFFYLGVRDKVECAFCGGVLHQWEQGDDPKVEHERHYSHCPFIRGYATSNVPLESTVQSSSQGDTNSNAKLSPFIQQSSLLQSATVNSPCQQQSRYSHENEQRSQAAGKKEPKHPELSSEELRFSTFLRWPLYSPVAPRKLAQAGFYYTHVDDQVRCFWCDGGLKDWQAEDDPWTEHARWYGEKCDFVLRQKTLSFVQEVKRRHPVLGQVPHEEKTFKQAFVSNGPAASGCQQTGVQDPQAETPHQAMFQEAMDSRLIQSALEMGFARQQVEKIVQTQLRRNGRPFAKMTDIVEALLAQEEGQTSDEDEEQMNESETKTQTAQKNPPVSGAQAPLLAPTVAQGNTGDEGQAPSDVISLQRQLQQLMEERMCKICMDETACMVLIPCGHMCCCENCVQMLRTRGGRCPMCRARIQRVQKTFVA